MATSNANQEEHGNTQQPSGQGNLATGPGTENPGNQTTSRISEGSSFTGESGVRVVPIRTMVAAVPAPFSRLPSDLSGNPVGLYYPVLGRFQHVASGHVTGEQGFQASGGQTEQPSVPESVVQPENSEDPARNGTKTITKSSIVMMITIS